LEKTSIYIKNTFAAEILFISLVTGVTNIMWDTQHKNIFLAHKDKHKIKSCNSKTLCKAQLNTLKFKNVVCTSMFIIPCKKCAYFLLAAKIYVTDTYLS